MKLVELSDNRAINEIKTLWSRLQESRSAMDTGRSIRESFGQAYGPGASFMLTTRGLPAGAYRVLRLSLDASRWSEDPTAEVSAEDTGQLPLHRDGVIAQIIRTPEPKLIDNVDWSSDPYYHGVLRGYGSLMAIPVAGERLRIDWAILLKRSPARFTCHDLEGAMLRLVLAASLIESQELASELAQANRRIEAEMRQVGALQRSLLPDPLPQIPGLEIAASYEPSGRAGGDLYDVFPLDITGGPSGQWCIFIGDASGHGIASAVVIAMIQSILRTHPRNIDGPAGLLGYVNRQLCRKQLEGFVTAFLAFYDPATRRLTYASAGHPPPLVRAASGGRVKRLSDASGYPLGVDASHRFVQASLPLHQGAKLLFYTDGITEARGHDREFFDVDRLEFAFADSDCEPTETVQRLCKIIDEYQPGARPVDDQTMVVLELV
jgi:sigma-B regulation protein RsbU (phosphoserine phosphatase)